ncbi:hypothetical protein LXL04_035112 [Taraxacum kok-saghyz]
MFDESDQSALGHRPTSPLAAFAAAIGHSVGFASGKLLTWQCRCYLADDSVQSNIANFDLIIKGGPRAVGDGDGVIVYVSTSDARELARVSVPLEIQMTVGERKKARAQRNNAMAEALYTQIKDAGYGGIDAPENEMRYGIDAKNELVKIIGGKCLRIFIFYEDQYGRFVGDMYCDDIFVQEVMLKKGLASYDNRPEFRKWEKDARAMKIGLWASPNPEKPWEWRKNQRDRSEKLCLLYCFFALLGVGVMLLGAGAMLLGAGAKFFFTLLGVMLCCIWLVLKVS